MSASDGKLVEDLRGGSVKNLRLSLAFIKGNGGGRGMESNLKRETPLIAQK